MILQWQHRCGNVDEYAQWVYVKTIYAEEEKTVRSVGPDDEFGEELVG